MPNGQKHPVTGCYAETLYGLWLAPFEYVDSLVNTAWGVVERNELQTVAARSYEADTAKAEAPAYTLTDDGIARLSIAGPMTKHTTSFSSMMGGTSTLKARAGLADIRDKAKMGQVKGVLLDMDSGGGTAEGTAELAAAVRKTAAVVPVFAHAEDKACSAALWVASQATRFTCGPAASVGSMGTMLQLWDRSKDSSGKPVLITTGKYKGIGAEGVAITDEHKAELQRRVDQVNAPFAEDVKRARHLSDDQLSEVSTARVFVGPDARRVGLVDGVCTTDDALAQLRLAIQKKAKIMLTAEQLAQAAKLPGCADITVENADVRLLTFAQTTYKSATDAAQAVTDITAKLPKAISAEALPDLLAVRKERLELSVAKGKLLPAQQSVLDTVIGCITTKAELALFDGFVAVLNDNTPIGLLNKPVLSASQPAPRTEPGATPSTDVKAPETRAEHDAMRAKFQMGTMSDSEWAEVQKLGTNRGFATA